MFYSIDDPYTYPKSPVLRNLAGIQEFSRLEIFEANAVLRRSIELSFRPVLGSFDSTHLKAIHGYLFQEVYEWAGKFRVINIGRSGQVIFAHFDNIEPYLANVFKALMAEKQLRGLSLAAFAERSAYYLGELNALHPFREGNGRTQREFIRELAEKAGFEIAWDRVDRAALYDASEVSFVSGDNKPLARILTTALTVRP